MKYVINIIRLIFLGLFLFLISNGQMMLWLALYGVSLVASLLFGRFYCGYICPMNTLMVPTNIFAKKIKSQKEDAPKWLRSGKFGWFALIGSIIIMVLSKKMLKMNLPLLLVWLVLSIIITIRYNPAVFHNLICPFGKPLELLGKFAIFSQRVNKDKCIGCKRCESVCPSDCITVEKEDKKAEINIAFCHQCTNCQQICPTDAINYSKQ